MADRRSARVFGAVLKRHRRAAGISQEKLAERAGLDRTSVGLLERGQRRPGLDTILDLGDGLGLAPGRLLDETCALLLEYSRVSPLPVGSST
ncbi:MAG: helix-turn-helix domain-containing protein [Acidimicrobiia bacterium]|nr:helix-turn-helix domain-containing protein [Acidimicrobiia bacterium]